MRLLLVVSALVATSLCYTWQDLKNDIIPNESHVTDSPELEYEFESQILTGLPTFSKQYTGLKIVSDVKLIGSESPFTLLMSSVKVLTLNKEISDSLLLPPSAQLPLSSFTEIPSDESSMILDKLQLPIKYHMSSHLINKLEVAEQDTNWSVDIKRGILSLLQVKLEADATDEKINEDLPYNHLENDHVTTFDVEESGPDGSCLSTLHVFNSERYEDVYKVIKARDHTRCIKINVVDKNVHPQQQINCHCRDNLNNQQCRCLPVSNYYNSTEAGYDSDRTEYEISSTDLKKLTIKKAVRSVQFRLETPHRTQEHILTVSNQTLVFVANRSSSHIPEVSYKVISDPWKLFIFLDQEQPMMSQEQILEKIRKMLTELETITSNPERYDDQITVFLQLIDALRLCENHNLQTLFSETKHDGRKGKLFLDGLRSANSSIGDEAIVDWIVHDEIDIIESVSVLFLWTTDKVPTKPLLDLFLNKLPTLEQQGARYEVYKQAMLCFGSMVRRYIHSEEVKLSQCVLPKDQQFHRKNIDDCRKYEKYVEGQLSLAKDDSHKIMLLKTITNLGSIESLPMLHDLLKQTESTAVRVHAIWAFKNMGFQNKLKVIQSLLPIMLHHHEDSELRIAAFVMVMKCNPTDSLLFIQKHINQEKNLEYKSFVVKYMRNMLDDSQNPVCANCNMRIREVLKTIDAFRMSYKSNDWQLKYGLKSDEANGDMIRVSTVGNSTSKYPRASNLQQFTGRQNKWQHLWEIGFRAEGLEELLQKVSTDVPTSSMLRSSIRNLRNRMNKPVTGSSVGKPSLTLYARILGQQVSFLHLDEKALATLLMSVSLQGSKEIPVSIFNTVLIKPRSMQALQPTGSTLTTKTSYVAVIDLQGTLKIDIANGKYPIITFQTDKLVRAEVTTIWQHEISSGFLKAGLTSSILVRNVIKAGHTSIVYNMQQNLLVINNTEQDPARNCLYESDLRAVTGTFLVPNRLPRYITTRALAVKELPVDESEKKIINAELTSFRSVEMEAKVQGEVNMPELYSFVRDRMSLLPTYLSIFKQRLLISLKPTVSSQRTYTTTLQSRYFTPTDSQIQRIKEAQRGEPKPKKNEGLFSILFGDNEEQQQDVSFFQPQTLGSLFYVGGVSLASVSNENKVLNMSANGTIYYEHDLPSKLAIYEITRPPVKENGEQESFRFCNKLATSINSGIGQVVQAYNITWGPESKPEAHKIKMNVKYTPNYKDEVCIRQNAYGCRDEYGVTYPIYSNNTIEVEAYNTIVPELIRGAVEPYLTNAAQSVYMYPIQQKKLSSPITLKMNTVVRPYENTLDYIISDDLYVMNFSRVYSPFEVKLNNYITFNQYPVSNLVYHSGNDLLPMHHLSGPISEHRDYCVYSSAKISAYDRKELLMPNTDCEIMFTGECQSSRSFYVSVIPDKTRNIAKIVKTKIDETMVEFKLKEESQSVEIEVYVNGHKEDMRQHDRLNITGSDGKQIAVVECVGKERCQLLSIKKGVYVNLQEGLAAVELDHSKVSEMCGVCKPDPSRPSPASAAESKAVIEKNRLPGKQCSIQTLQSYIGSDSPQNQCQKLNTHRMVTLPKSGEMKKCVSEYKVPVCSEGCKKEKKRHQELISTSCVSESQASKIGLHPHMEGTEQIVEVSESQLQQLKQEGEQQNIRMQVYDSCQ